jgi:hypothetical protein
MDFLIAFLRWHKGEANLAIGRQEHHVAARCLLQQSFQRKPLNR